MLSSLFFNIKRFQSTLPRRERPFILPIPPIHQTISIHAPAKGATGADKRGKKRLIISIHAPAKGATIILYTCFHSHANFNPRSREGSDSSCSLILPRAAYFNPRSREGSDGSRRRPVPSCLYFNPRSREGSDPCSVVITISSSDFNPRSREGSDW